MTKTIYNTDGKRVGDLTSDGRLFIIKKKDCVTIIRIGDNNKLIVENRK